MKQGGVTSDNDLGRLRQEWYAGFGLSQQRCTTEKQMQKENQGKPADQVYLKNGLSDVCLNEAFAES